MLTVRGDALAVSLNSSVRGSASRVSLNHEERSLVDRKAKEIAAGSGVGLGPARKLAKENVKAAIALSKQRGTYELPRNLGDFVLGRTAMLDQKVQLSVSKIKRTLGAKRYFGATDEDIAWWWNLGPVERALIEVEHNLIAVPLIEGAMEQGHFLEEAECLAYMQMPKYGELDDDNDLSDSDLPLPWELKSRIDEWVVSNGQILQGKHEYSSLNALIRNLIEKGRI